MELQKLKADRDAFAQRLRAAIQSEIDTFIAAGGIHPESIDVEIITSPSLAFSGQTSALYRVRVRLGL